MNILERKTMLALINSCIPPLSGSSHKGQAGRIGIVGGSLEYTGAPYFAAISALKVGADLVHVFCSASSAPIIKSYSPELIVHPLLDHKDAISEISPWLDRLHAIVIGPGLGRADKTFETVSQLIGIIKEKKIPLVIDADGLFLITQQPALIKDFSSPIILTPNKIEFERLIQNTGGISDLHKSSKYTTVLKKGENDEVLSPDASLQWQSSVGGSARRCGGQGDLLSGSLAVFLYWCLLNGNKLPIDKGSDSKLSASSFACYASSALVRLCNEKAFKLKGRSMLATDMIEQIHDAFNQLYGE
ncbi:ATP-dependent (S)-NAD(P)H-hydrate dehydratase [Aricia agestis]|uniref:ATP-dependent (S)-NAD(P)H-hydrate dehydratase n=1 Tax=Aricia agestis TaxID=91739 RepID=UPI001C20B527|nr:ATP-dependent (S)-NAD(P)H-hydrate dehydratase [Aricia agestis]